MRWYIRQVLASAACGTLLAACGSTVGDQAGQGPGPLGLATGPTAAAVSNAPGGQAVPAGTGPASPGGLPLTQQAQPGDVPAANASKPSVVAGLIPGRGPGITGSTISVGFLYNSQRSATAIALGAAGAASSYNTRDVIATVIRYANSHGGFAGRKLEPVFYDSNGADAQTLEAQGCAAWTQDHKVFVMPGGQDPLDECAERAHAIPLGAGSATATTYQRFPHLVDPDTMRLDRLATATTNGLYRSGYFTGKLGLVTWDNPDYRYAMSHGYLPALAAIHVKPVDIAYLSPPPSPGALPDMASAVASYVTKFHSEGIDHVIIQDGPAGFCSDGCQTLVWMNQARSQQWYPRYGENSHNAPGSAVMPSDEMDHALAVDSSDSDPVYDSGWHLNTARQQCFKIQADAGLPVKNSVDEAYAALYCDQVFFLQRVINSLSVLDVDSFLNAVTSLGSNFRTAFVYGSKFGPGRRDGASLIRTEEYFNSCRCLKYQGAPYDPDR